MNDLMKSYEYFNEVLIKRIPKNYIITTSFFKDGQFGDLYRIEFESEIKVGNIDFWTLGWVELDIFDLGVDNIIFNKLFAPEESNVIIKSLEYFVEVLND